MLDKRPELEYNIHTQEVKVTQLFYRLHWDCYLKGDNIYIRKHNIMAKTKKTQASKIISPKKLSGVIWDNDTPNLKKMADELNISLSHAVSLPAYALESAAEKDYPNASSAFSRIYEAHKHQLPKPRGIKGDAEFTPAVSDESREKIQEALEVIEKSGMSQYDLSVVIVKMKNTGKYKKTASLPALAQNAA
jgi:hypothetical protein